jgi:hypothetical protein
MRAHILLSLLAGVTLTACRSIPGKDGAPGPAGEDGANGESGAEGADGEPGAGGADGEAGADGETADTLDDDGDGVPLIDDCDDNDGSVGAAQTVYLDADGDGFGTDFVTDLTCEPGSGWVSDGGDCDDDNTAVNPSISEVCNGIDDDCDELIDDNDDSIDLTDGADYYVDSDLDGFGDETVATVLACSAYEGLADVAGDCDDTLDTVNPAAEEICENGIDDNCNNSADQCGLTDGSTITDADYTVTNPNANSSDYFGRQLAAGDFNGDSYADVLIGSYTDDDNGTSSGSAFITYGGTTISESTSGSVYGPSSYDYLGFDLDSAGDINNDGYDDILVSAYGVDSTYIIYGSNTAWSSSEDIGTVADARITADSPIYYFGYDVSAVGDFNDDGYDDFLVSDYGSLRYDTSVYLFTGSTSGLVGDITAEVSSYLRIDADDTGDYLGYTNASGYGDFNGDGYSDISLGEYSNDDNGSTYGMGYVYYGPLSGDTNTASAETTINTSTATEAGAFGYAVAGIGDFNDDGYEELAVGAYYEASSAGRTYIYFGSSTGWAASIDHDTADLIVTGVSANDYYCRPYHLGDLNGDGIDDFGIGGVADDTGGTNAGSVALMYGVSGSTGGAFPIDSADARLTGDNSYDYVGYSADAADVNGNGYRDLIVGAYGANSYSGAVSIFVGSGY